MLGAERIFPLSLEVTQHKQLSGSEYRMSREIGLY